MFAEFLTVLVWNSFDGDFKAKGNGKHLPSPEFQDGNFCFVKCSVLLCDSEKEQNLLPVLSSFRAKPPHAGGGALALALPPFPGVVYEAVPSCRPAGNARSAAQLRLYQPSSPLLAVTSELLEARAWG